MKPIDQMDSNEINRAIAELRGELVLSAYAPVGKVIGYPDYLEWANCGKLLEEMEDVRVETENWYHGWRVSWFTGKYAGDGKTPVWNGICVALGELTKAIRRAYYEWKRGEEDEG